MSEIQTIKSVGEPAAAKKASVHLANLNPADPVVRTHGLAPSAIDSTEKPGGASKLEKGRFGAPPSTAMNVSNAASDAGIGASKSVTDFALASIMVAMAREKLGSEKLRVLSTEVKSQLTDIDLLLDLNSELTMLPDRDSYQPTEKMKGIFSSLEMRNIKIWKGDFIFGKEKLGEMKAQISSQIDKLRTSIQTTISTEIQPETTNLQSIMNIVQQIIQSDARLKRKATEVPR